MVQSKGWNWENVSNNVWLEPSEESYYYAYRWKKLGFKKLLDLGCGLGRHSMLFAENDFQVTACDISDYGIKYLEEWKSKESVSIETTVCDMLSLPFADNIFDCIYAYHVLSHTDTEGEAKIFSEISRVMKSGAEIFFDMLSKDSWTFSKSRYPKLDENTVVPDIGNEDGIPHFCADEAVIRNLLTDFDIVKLRHIFDIADEQDGGGTHYFVLARKK